MFRLSAYKIAAPSKMTIVKSLAGAISRIRALGLAGLILPLPVLPLPGASTGSRSRSMSWLAVVTLIGRWGIGKNRVKGCEIDAILSAALDDRLNLDAAAGLLPFYVLLELS